MNNTHFLIVFLFCVLKGLSQDKKNKDSTSIISYSDKIIIKANINTQTDSYTFQSENDSDFRLSLNNQFRLVLSLDYEFIGASFGFSPKFFPENNDNDLKGKSSYSDYSFRFFLENWIQKIQYKKVQGFYVENIKDFIPDWVEGQDSYIQFPDLKIVFWGGSTSYVLNPNFSLRNVLYNTEWQRKSAGSFIPTFNYGYTHLSGIVGGNRFYEDSFDFAISPEYYYTLVVHENWFASFSASPSLGVRFSKEGEDGVESKEENVYWPVSFDGGLQVGYSSNKFIYGANLKFETTWYNDDLTNVTNDGVFAQIYLGYRFDTPKKVEKAFRGLNKKLGL